MSGNKKLPAEGGAMFYPEIGPKCRCANRKPGEPCTHPTCMENAIASSTPSKDLLKDGEKVYRWVKAVDRLPDAKKPIFFEYSFPGYETEKLAGSMIDYGEGGKYFVSGGLSFHKWEYLKWLEEIPAPLNQPGIDREEKSIPKGVAAKILAIRDALVRDDYDEAWHQLYSIASPKFDKIKPWREMEQIAEYKKPDSQNAPAQPVSAVNAPTEIPEEIKYWVEQFAECDADNDATLWINGAKSMYRKLAEDKMQEYIGYDGIIKKVIEENKMLHTLQASLSSIKGERDALRVRVDDSIKEKRSLEGRLANAQRDRDLARNTIKAYSAEIELLRNAITLTKAERDQALYAAAQRIVVIFQGAKGS